MTYNHPITLFGTINPTSIILFICHVSKLKPYHVSKLSLSLAYFQEGQRAHTLQQTFDTRMDGAKTSCSQTWALLLQQQIHRTLIFWLLFPSSKLENKNKRDVENDEGDDDNDGIINNGDDDNEGTET